MSVPNEYREDEITLKELILKIQEYGREVVKNWFLIGLIILPVLGFFMYKHYTHVPKYEAELRFVVEGQGGSGGGLSSLLGTFGIKKGGQANPYKILEVGRSSKIFEKVIFERIQEATFAERLLREFELLEKWSKINPNYVNFRFSDKTPKTLMEKSVFKKLKSLVWGGEKTKGLCSFSLNEDNGIYSIRCITPNDELSTGLTNSFYDRIKLFFEDEVFQNQKKSAEILAIKSDSINSLKNQKVYQLARFEDRNIGLISKETSTRKIILKQEIQALAMAYGELIKNYEMTDVNLQDLQPLFMEIDRPYLPIRPSNSSLLRNLVLGLFLGLFFGGSFVVLRKIYNDIMK